MSSFQSYHSYEEFLYTLRNSYGSVLSSTLILVRRGKRTAIVQGELLFAEGFRLSIRERLSSDGDEVLIESYGYELWRMDEKIAWYDSQPHPEIPELAPTFPHHKHIPPDIRNHRVPAPNLYFDRPNLPVLIQEIELMIKEEYRK